MLRHRVRSVLVVCPSSLQIQWRDQMRDKFGLEFRIVDSELMRELRRARGIHVNPWAHFPRLITSIDYLKRERPLRLFRELLPPVGRPSFPRRFDLLIVDEAHNIAPAGAARYARPSMRTQAVRSIAPHFEHRLFLTATPHNGYIESFTALLEVLDNQRFARAIEPDRDQLAAVMVRRMKSEITDWRGRPRFPRRFLQPIEVAYPSEETDAHAELARYAELRKASGSEANAFAVEFVLKLLKKRLFSSPEAFRQTLEKHRASVSRPATADEAPQLAQFKRQVDDIEEDFADDEAYEESETEAIQAAGRLAGRLSAEEEALLERLQRFAERASGKADAKARALIEWLEASIRPNGVWSDERVIIFTEYRATQKWLYELLAARGFARNERLLMLYGGMDKEGRERIKAAFQAHPDQAPVRILLATDAASEGIDLQNHCSKLIHYEIPWNPNRLEQRNGRVDRHGQRADKVEVFHFVGSGYRVQDLDVLLLAHFGQRRDFRPSVAFRPREAVPVRPRQASVWSLALVVEVKQHDARAVRFEGTTVQVRYRRGGEESWENASEQSHEQLHALRQYLNDHGLGGIFITNLILFPNLREGDLPARPHNIIGGDASFAKILNVLGEVAGPWIQGDRAVLSAGRLENVEALFQKPLFRSLEPTTIDRRRMDRIARKGALNKEWLNELGERQIIFRGRGGAGKTVILLQLAYHAFDERRTRSLLLTYNRALIADIRRTMALFGMPESIAKGGIRIDSVMSFIGRVLHHFGLIKKDEDFLESYEENCSTLAELLRSGDIPAEEVAAMRRGDAPEFAFDHVFVDEGQDWPDSEIAILRALYPPERLVIADGIDQFVRGSVADWESGVERPRLRVRRLLRCLRMKSNLAAFANAFAREVELEGWRVEPNPRPAAGGS